MGLLDFIFRRKKPTPTPVPPSPTPSDIPQALLAAHNKIRTSRGLQPLRLQSALTSAAQSHSADMANSRKFSHRGSDGSDVSLRVRRAGYNFIAIGENIAWNQTTVDQVMDSWMNSSGHRANILSRHYVDFGGARSKGIDGSFYWTIVFGRPL